MRFDYICKHAIYDKTLRPKLGFFTFYWLQKEEIASPITSMQYCTHVRAITYRKQQTLQL